MLFTSHRRLDLAHAHNTGGIQVLTHQLNSHATKAKLGAGAKHRARANEGVEYHHPRCVRRDVLLMYLHHHVRRKAGLTGGRGSAIIVGGRHEVADAAVVASVNMQGFVAQKTLALRVPMKDEDVLVVAGELRAGGGHRH